jgi:hypothetical protein
VQVDHLFRDPLVGIGDQIVRHIVCVTSRNQMQSNNKLS